MRRGNVSILTINLRFLGKNKLRRSFKKHQKVYYQLFFLLKKIKSTDNAE